MADLSDLASAVTKAAEEMRKRSTHTTEVRKETLPDAVKALIEDLAGRVSSLEAFNAALVNQAQMRVKDS